MGRLSAVSCLVTSSRWQTDGQLLRASSCRVDKGLHFNLTEGAGRDALSTLMMKAISRQLDQKAIEAECERQIDLFQTVMGCLPDFIDGHQHVHSFPVVRDAV